MKTMRDKFRTWIHEIDSKHLECMLKDCLEEEYPPRFYISINAVMNAHKLVKMEETLAYTTKVSLLYLVLYGVASIKYFFTRKRPIYDKNDIHLLCYPSPTKKIVDEIWIMEK